jgi:hypothetical protein
LGQFFKWVNSKSKAPSLINAALGHLWFVTLHPFEDGNGRIARAIGDMLIARSDGSAQRFYSISAQIQRDRKGYYDILERTQKHSMDVTEWLAWFLDTLERALEQAHMPSPEQTSASGAGQDTRSHQMHFRSLHSLPMQRSSVDLAQYLRQDRWTGLHLRCPRGVISMAVSLVQYLAWPEMLMPVGSLKRHSNSPLMTLGALVDVSLLLI